MREQITSSAAPWTPPSSCISSAMKRETCQARGEGGGGSRVGEGRRRVDGCGGGRLGAVEVGGWVGGCGVVGGGEGGAWGGGAWWWCQECGHGESEG